MTVDILVAGHFIRIRKLIIIESVQAADIEAFGPVKLKNYRPSQVFLRHYDGIVAIRPFGCQRQSR